ncbi:PAS domain S-box protein [Leptolyngbya cf. ectocarpi LEGE 11479]|uniref:histidine kinase n=1 Tax=Leptolyngbya cf. ectocarpi LEGE 11479 TaxID=1828722 RepID=A0A928WYN7_LEPEC|nr:PAS domain-containing sensor histidine kinase [Leptolyngbya ectocarpi]MBE9065267.1 PAS domain S-box protein [Leptolyngbya cf. ectocarpi LEGE 11479]
MNSDVSSQISSGDWAHFFSLSPSLLAVVGTDGYIKRVNPVFDQCLGWERTVLLSKPFIAFIHPDDQAASTGAMDQAISTGQTVVFRNRYHCFDGSWMQLEWTIGAAQAADVMYCMARDCTGQTKPRPYLSQLAAQKQQLQTIFDRAGVGIARLALDGQWIQANDKLCEILNYSKTELLQTDFQSITHPDDAAQDMEHYQALLKGTSETVVLEKRYLRKGGEPIWCRVTASIIHDGEGYFIAFIEDITERKANEHILEHQKDELARNNLILAQMTASLGQRNQELDEFAYVASHDLKAPLRAIANLATWLEEDLDGQLPAENKQQLELLQGRVHRMENLIDGLLAYSRVGRGDQITEPVDLNVLLRNLVDLLDPPPGFTIAIAPNLPTLNTARPALNQVFANLLSNAIKHHDRTDGHIDIRCQLLENGLYEFSVTDDGPGIDPAFHQKIFNIFQILEARDKTENTGIGLSIVKKTVEAEGGNITLDSQVGQGCTFRFTWPQKS